MRKRTDATIVAGVQEATAAWQAAQDTTYFAQRFGYSVRSMLVILKRLEADGRLVSRPVYRYGAPTRVWMLPE